MPLRSPLIRFFCSAVLCGVICLAGCDSAPGVTTYRIPTTPPVEFKAETNRMLAAMVPQGDQVWFFKVVGPDSAVSSIAEPFRQFVEEVEFTDGQPKLDELPEGWRRGGERMMRFATIDIDTPEKQLDISISQLARQDAYDEMVAMNVNRWRGQLGLDKSADKWAEGDPIEIASADGPAVWVDIEGDAADTSSMTPPFAGGMMPPFAGAGSAPPKVDRKPAAPPGNAGESRNAERAGKPVEPKSDDRIQFDAPDDWRPSKGSSMRLASFKMGPEDAEAELTVIPAGGDLRGNVARWIGQIWGEAPPEEVVDAALEAGSTLDVDGKESQRFLLVGKEESSGDAIDATIVPLADGFSLFIKMTGPVQTVRDQSDSITKYLESLKVNL